ncbi:hypothetical protein [Bacillus sp. AK128]
MKTVFKHIFAILGIAFAIALMLFATAISMGSQAMEELLITSSIYSGLALVGYMISGIMPRLGGWFMIIGGLVFSGQYETLGFLGVGLPLLFSGILSIRSKKKKRLSKVLVEQ